MAQVTDHLFVYGTLRPAASGAMGRSERERLQREAVTLGAATVAGRLYDLGPYPGLVLSDDVGAQVQGELLRLSDPARTLRWLDAYEGIAPGEHRSTEYERVVSLARLGDGREVELWVYRYAHGVTGHPLLAGGDWLQR